MDSLIIRLWGIPDCPWRVFVRQKLLLVFNLLFDSSYLIINIFVIDFWFRNLLNCGQILLMVFKIFIIIRWTTFIFIWISKLSLIGQKFMLAYWLRKFEFLIRLVFILGIFVLITTCLIIFNLISCLFLPSSSCIFLSILFITIFVGSERTHVKLEVLFLVVIIIIHLHHLRLVFGVAAVAVRRDEWLRYLNLVTIGLVRR